MPPACRYSEGQPWTVRSTNQRARNSRACEYERDLKRRNSLPRMLLVVQELYAGIHMKVFDLHRLLAKRFPYAVYYKVDGDVCTMFRVLDCRQEALGRVY